MKMSNPLHKSIGEKTIEIDNENFFFVFCFCYDHLSIVVFRSLCIYYYAVHIFQCSLLESQAVIKGGESPAGGGGGGVWKSCLRPRTSTWQPEL